MFNLKSVLVASLVATGLAFASVVSAQPEPEGDWTAKGTLAVTNADESTFTCKVTLHGRHSAFVDDEMNNWDGVIHTVRVQNTKEANQPVPGTVCGGNPNFPLVGFIHGVRAFFGNNANGPLHWPYVIDLPNNEIEIHDVQFRADPQLGEPGCGVGVLTADWTNGDPDFSDGDVHWARIGDGTLVSASGSNDCEIEGPLDLYFKVGLDA